MVARGDGYILSTSGLNGSYPLICIEVRGVKSLGQLGVFLVVDVAIGHHPFAFTNHRVESPM